MILLDADSVAASRPGRPLFADLSLTLSSGDRLAVVGINGGGKSTLLRVLAGSEAPENGVVRRGRGARVVLLSQVDQLPAGTVAAAVGEGWEASAALDRLGLTPLLGADVATLSGGEGKRVALARALVELGPPGRDDDAVLLLLDEPTNHLDVDAIAWLEDRLAVHRGGLVLVTHDRHVLDRVTTRIMELDRGKAFLHDGGYASWLESQVERQRQADKAEDVRRNLARTELAWLRRGAPARTAKPKARIASATALVEGKAEAAARKGDLDLSFGTPRLGDKVLSLHGVGHRFEGGRWLFRNVDLDIGPDERLGIVGPNGVGKSTLLDILAGRLEPTEGTVERGPTVRLGVYDQRGRELDLSARVRDVVAGPHRQADWEDARFMERFWFDGDAQWAPVGLLSGGERRRLQLVLTLRDKPNVVFLDEPTNDLDLDTLRTIEDVLETWPGALVVVSHDRAFLERTVTDVVVVDEGGTVERRAGGYAGWDAERRRRRSATGPGGGGGAKLSAPRPAPALASSSPSTRRHQLRKLERDVARHGRRRDELLVGLAEAGGDHRAHADLGTQLATVQQELAIAEERWLELSVQLE